MTLFTLPLRLIARSLVLGLLALYTTNGGVKRLSNRNPSPSNPDYLDYCRRIHRNTLNDLYKGLINQFCLLKSASRSHGACRGCDSLASSAKRSILISESVFVSP